MKTQGRWLTLVLGTMLACGGDDDGGGDTGADDGATSPADDDGATMFNTMPSTMSDTMAMDDGDDDGTPGTSSSGGADGSSSGPGDGSSSGGGDSTTGAAAVTASVDIAPLQDSGAMGTGVFTLGAGMTDLLIDLTGVMPPGTHALHIHEFADCSGDGTAAGMHWNPAGTMLGELGTLEIAEDGTGTFTKTDAWTVGDGGETDVVGKSIIIHEAADGGPRLACGIIELD